MGDSFRIDTYIGYGTAARIRVRGRVLRGDAPPAGDPERGWVRNARAVYSQLESDEVPGAHLRIEVAGARVEAFTDGEGYYDEWFVPVRLGTEAWIRGKARLLAAAGRTGTSERPLATAEVSVLAPQSPALGVISDIDDTVLVSDAAHALKSVRRLLAGNARTRLPFAGVVDFYRALAAGKDASNPLFYVSSSPWNLHAMLVEFFAHNGLPPGPLFLRDYGLRALPGVGSHSGHKLAAIEEILGLWPALPFVLLGDSGQEDPEIYAEAVRRAPGRIAAIYIRDVSETARDESVTRLAQETSAAGVPMLLVADSWVAWAHAFSMGLVAVPPPLESERE